MRKSQSSNNGNNMVCENITKYTELREVEILRKAKQLLEVMKKP